MPAAVVAVATSGMLLVLGIMAIAAVFISGIHAGRCGSRCVRLHLLMVRGVLSSGSSLAPCGGCFGGAGV